MKHFNSYIEDKIKIEDANYERIFAIGNVERKGSFNWFKFLSERERQWWIPFCTTFSRLVCAVAVGNKAGIKLNLSERRLGVESGTNKIGNTLEAVSEWFRKKGVDTEEDTPFTPEMFSDGWPMWEKIFDLPKAGKRYKGGNHSWVWSKQGMIDALDHSPLQIIVQDSNYNWERDGEVQNPTRKEWAHAVAIYHIDELGRYHVRDSIGKPDKILNKNYPIKWCKSFRDLPENWKEKNMIFYKKKGTTEIYQLGLGDKKYHHITEETLFRDLYGDFATNKIEEIEIPESMISNDLCYKESIVQSLFNFLKR